MTACVTNPDGTVDSSGVEAIVRAILQDPYVQEDFQGEHGDPGAPGEDGAQGSQGNAGEPGEDGQDGVDGISCWDLNENGIRDLPDEDRDGDGDVDVDDCSVGPPGPRGEQGEKGDPGLPGKDGTDGVNGADGADGEQGAAGPPGCCPIVELNQADTSINMTTSWQTVLQISITAPSSGKIHLIGNAWLNVAGNDGDLGIAPTGGTPSFVQRANHLDHTDGARANVPTSVQWVTSVGPGTHTYALMTRRLLNNDGHISSAVSPQLSATFYPD
jgi:hypothetical protein